MPGIANIVSYFWAITVVAELVLLSSLAIRKDYREYPAFFIYILGTVLQAVVLFLTYRRLSFNSMTSWRVAWSTQIVLVVLQGLVVAEICHRLLGKYRGVWALTWRILVTLATCVLVYAFLASGHNRLLLMPILQRALELAIATTIVTLFVFARYYEIEPDSAVRALGLGFLLMACFVALNNTFLERFIDRYAPLWTFLDMLAFFACVVIWGFALRQPRRVASEARLLSSEIYSVIMPEMNLRLRLLNERLSRFLRVEAGPR